ncbi:hypothetical protein [Streptomyces rishiriensis]|uniref:Ig-like domain-containing protein n=1 Tax=Streptomyces rishiriensis TaxID=68264 RepID=A0ABU0NJF5_STRRH|nr:hypothetical protein [Streptomyces rishiriensis]MDQ0578742.1 hypothetical protein [Streptomyces rishiriensis]
MNRPDPHDRPASPPLPPAPPGDNEDYSATALASHWIQRPETDPTAVLDGPTAVLDGPTAVLDDHTVVEDAAPPEDRTAVAAPTPDGDGTVLRFGPGVTAALARQPHRTLPAVPAPPVLRRGRPRRYALPALVLVAAVLLLLWRESTGLGVRSVSVTAARDTLDCDSTAGIVGVVRTDGRPGTLTYRWLRSDGTSSALRHADVVRGQRTVRLELLWTFEGPGRLRAVAELRVLAPEPHAAEVRFTYDCPRAPHP